MNSEELEQKLIEESQKQNINLLQLSLKLAEEYAKYFSTFKIKKIDYNKIDTFKATRLNIFIRTVNQKERKILQFKDVYRLNLNSTSYVKVNLKGYIVDLIWNNEVLYLEQVITLRELLAYINNEPKYKDWITNYQNELYLKSLIYAYAYNILLKNAKENIDYVRAGMFKNAYFDIIEYQNSILDIQYKR